jgi:hypothetical protein
MPYPSATGLPFIIIGIEALRFVKRSVRMAATLTPADICLGGDFCAVGHPGGKKLGYVNRIGHGRLFSFGWLREYRAPKM